MFEIKDKMFYEKINIVKLKYILKNPDKYKQKIESQKRHKDQDKQVPIWTLMKNILKKCICIPNSEYGFIPVQYVKGSNSNNIGRWYAQGSIGLAPLCGIVRHTICDDLWYDIDQVNSHINIMKHFVDKLDLKSPTLEKIINQREECYKIVMQEENCDRDDAKRHIISSLNGKIYKTNFIKQLSLELMPCMHKMVEMDEYIDIFKQVKRTSKYNYIGKTVSKILQVVENSMLETYIEYCIDNKIITSYKSWYIVSLIFDGFQLEKKSNINDDTLELIRKYTFDKTGFDIPLVFKQMNNKLEIPDDYNEVDLDNDFIDDDDDIDETVLSYYDVKNEFEKKFAKILYPPCIINTETGYMQNTKNSRESHSHIACYHIDKKTKKKIQIQFIHKWLIDKDVRKFDEIVWKPPPSICDDKYQLNTWRGFKIADCDDEDLCPIKNRNYFDEFKQFVHNLFPVEIEANYIISRYAYRIQNPSLKTKICFVIYGPEGIGKSTLIETIYSIFGEYGIQLQSAKQLYKDHSTVEKEKLLVCVNEVGGVTNFENSETLKTRVTENKLHINPKGIQAYDIDNFADYDMTTNNVNVIKNSDESKRRWFQAECSCYYCDDEKFFIDYYKYIVNNPYALKKIYEGLLEWKCQDYVENCDFQKCKPITKISLEVREANRCKFIYFLTDFLKDTTEDETKINNKELFILFSEWCNENNIKLDCNTIQFGIKISKIGKTIEAKIKNKKGIWKDTNNNTCFNKSVFDDYMKILTQ